MEMKYRYFKLNEADSIEYYKEYQKKVETPREKAIRDFLRECNAAGYLLHRHFGVESVSALLVREYVDYGRNKRSRSHSFDEDGQALFEVRPDRRYVEGKRLDARLKEMNKKLQELPVFNVWAVKALNCRADANWIERGRCYTTWSGAGFYPERTTLVVRIPVGENGNLPLPADMSPALIEIKHSEFIAITEE